MASKFDFYGFKNVAKKCIIAYSSILTRIWLKELYKACIDKKGANLTYLEKSFTPKIEIIIAINYISHQICLVFIRLPAFPLDDFQMMDLGLHIKSQKGLDNLLILIFGFRSLRTYHYSLVKPRSLRLCLTQKKYR